MGPTEDDTRWSHPTRPGVPGSNGETIVYEMIEPDPPTVETTPGQRWLVPAPEVRLHAIVFGAPLVVLILVMAIIMFVRGER